MRRLDSHGGAFSRGGLVAALGVATAMACAQSPDESAYGLGGIPDAGDDGSSVVLGDGAASSSGTSGKPADGGGSSSGSSGSSGGTCDGKVVINEVQTQGTSSSNEDFVELYNPSSCEVAIGGWELRYKSPGGTGPVLITFSANQKIAATGFLVIGTTEFKGAKDLTMTSGVGKDGGSIGLFDGGENTAKQVDAVGWGTATTGYFEGPRALAPGVDESIARKPDGIDTNDNAKDFQVLMTPKPGKPN